MAEIITGDSNSYDFSLSFYRVSPDNKILKREKYALYSVDGKDIELEFTNLESGRQRLTTFDDNIRSDKFYDIIPDYMLTEMRSLQTKEDAINYFSNSNVFRVHDYTSLKEVGVYFNLPVRIKQLEVEPGYYAHDVIVPFPFRLDVNYNNNSEITSIGVYTTFYELPDEYLYDDVVRTFTTVNDFDLPYRSFSLACLDDNAGMIAAPTDENCSGWEGSPSISLEYVPYFVATKGDIKYDIENSVNGVTRYNASNEKDLDYVINAKNTSDVVTSEIELVTYVPDEVIVKEDTISNNGVYNSSEHTITWTKDRMAIGEVLSVNYSAVAPDSKDEKELIGYSIIRSTQVTTGVQSNNTVVTLDNIVEIEETPSTPTNNSTPGNTTTNVENPYTGAKNFMGDTSITVQFTILIVFAILVFLTSLMYSKKKKKDKVI